MKLPMSATSGKGATAAEGMHTYPSMWSILTVVRSYFFFFLFWRNHEEGTRGINEVGNTLLSNWENVAGVGIQGCLLYVSCMSAARECVVADTMRWCWIGAFTYGLAYPLDLLLETDLYEWDDRLCIFFLFQPRTTGIWVNAAKFSPIKGD